MNIIPILLLALSISIGVLVTRVEQSKNTACNQNSKITKKSITPYTETEAAETLNIKEIIIL